MSRATAERESQSEFFARREAEAEAAGRSASGDFNFLAGEYKAPPLFPADAKKLVIFGLDDVLVHISPKVEDAYKVRTIEALRNMLPKGTEIDEAQVRALVHRSYEECHLPSRYVAEAYGVSERMLMSETLSLVGYKDIALAPNRFGMGDQGVLNYFAVAREQGIVPVVVTSSNAGFARSCLHYAVLDQYIGGNVFGVDSVGQDGPVLRKSKDGKAILAHVLKDVPADRLKDVIVVDHNAGWLASAQEFGLTAVHIDPKASAQSNVAAIACTSVPDMFKTVLGIQDPGSRRDDHIYAGVKMPAQYTA